MLDIPMGDHTVTAVCPRCRHDVPVLVALHTTLTVPDDGPPAIRVKLKSKPQDHVCGQRSWTVGAGALFAADDDRERLGRDGP